MYKFFLSFLLIFLFLVHVFSAENGNEKNEHKVNLSEEKFDPVKLIMDHIGDANEWHLWTTKDASGHEDHVSIPLPIIIYDHEGLKVFTSDKIAHEKEYLGYTLEDSKLKSLNGKKAATAFDLIQKKSNLFYDFSITKNVFTLFFSMVLLLLIFTSVVRVYKKHNAVPKGIAGFMEPLILFVKDDIAIPNIGEKKYAKYLPFLLTVFFFIWINNLMGLIPIFPFGANLTGNIATTFVLAMITLLITNLNGNKGYWKHIFMPPGVPIWLLPIMIPLELLGVFTKPFALMMRLFANVLAGHVMVLSIISLIFIFSSLYVVPGSIILNLFVGLIELLVAAIQAYIFTILSALYIGLAVADAEHQDF